MPALTHPRPSGKHLAFSIFAGLTLLLGTSAALYASPVHTGHASAPTTSKPFTLRSGRSDAPVRTGEVNLATLPIAKAGSSSGPAKPIVTARVPETPAQQAAHRQWAMTHPSALPHASGQRLPTRSPNFVGGLTIPELVNQADGINSTNPGYTCCLEPDPAIAAAPGYVFEGVNNELEVYTPSYAQKFGPWTAQTFFGPLYHTGDLFNDPQITFDAERSIYLIAWWEYKSDFSADYLDLAISKTSTPSPLSNYFEYQIPGTVLGTNFLCEEPTLGYDYWGVWVSCVTANSASTNPGNAVFVFSTNAMLAGNITGKYAWWYNIPTELNCGTGCTPAFWVSPSIEDGVPNAEWVIATDAERLGNSVTVSDNLTLCAFTNTHAIASGGTPTMSCDFNALPLSYTDPMDATENPAPTLWPGYGTKQIMYRSGRLYFAMTITINCGGTVDDGIAWYDVVPQLSTVAAHNPQLVNGIYGNFSEGGYWCFSDGTDSFMPVLSPSNEGDVSLIYNFSSLYIHPSIGYTGRMAADAPGTLGQGGNSAIVVSGTSDVSSHWTEYASCALTTNLVTRGIIFCAGEYGGADEWDTRLFQLRME
jgi:hypothetical protein